jgi:predicted O-methyltransferase YrrM
MRQPQLPLGSDHSPTRTWLHRWSAPIKRLLPGAVWQPLRGLATGIATPVRFSIVSGHWKSAVASLARAADGTALPWYTYPAIDFLAQRDFTGKNVLEFGGGQSTFWWSARAASVLTIEADTAWYRQLLARVGPNVRLHQISDDNPATAVAQAAAVLKSDPVAAFDVIVIDGHRRREMTALAFNYLAEAGALILDNAEGYGFYEETRDRDCSRIDFFGFAPGVYLRHCTAIVFQKSCFLLNADVPIARIC